MFLAISPLAVSAKPFQVEDLHRLLRLSDAQLSPDGHWVAFTVARSDVATKLLYFPDENHWVLKPANSILWYHTVLDWLNQWVKPDQVEYEKMKRS